MSNKTSSTSMSWFFVVNILTTILASSQIILGLIFMLIILSYRIYRTVSNCLATNTVFSITFYAMTTLLISIHILQCDNHPDQCVEDKICYFRDYINDVASTAAIYSLTVQSIHRLLAALFINDIRFQMYQHRLLLCSIQWLIALLFPAYFIYLDPQLEYDPVSYVCVISAKPTIFLTLYTLLIGFVIPVIIAVGVYIKLFLFVRQLRTSVFVPRSSITLSGKHELRMAKRVLLLLIILIFGAIPGTIFQTIKPPPVYQYRIYYLTVMIASFCCLICLFSFTPPARQRLNRWKKKIKSSLRCRRRRIVIVPQVNRY